MIRELIGRITGQASPGAGSVRVPRSVLRALLQSRRGGAKRGTEGGFNVAKSNRLMEDAPKTPIPIGSVLRSDLRALRAQSRHQCQNSDHAKRFVQLCKTNILGANGIRLQAQTKDPDGKDDEVANGAIEGAWDRWGEKGACDVTGRLSWIGVQRQVVHSLAQDGEAFIRLLRRGSHGLQLHVLDAELVDPTYRDDLRNGNIVRQGIEYDADDRAVAYHVMRRQRTVEWPFYQYVTINHTRIPAEQMLHVFLADDPGQGRGLPWTSTALFGLAMLGAYDNAALGAARVGAEKVGLLKPEEGEGYAGQDLGGDGDEDSPPVSVSEPVAFEQLPRGMSLESWDPTYPHEQYPHFQKAQLRRIASGMGTGYSSLSGDYEGVSFSSVRSEKLESWDVWMGLQRFVEEELCRPVFRFWLSESLARGMVTFPGGGSLPLAKEEKFAAVSWRPRRWPWVDPLKDTQAKVLAVRYALTTLSATIREQGQDPGEVFREWAEERRKLGELGIELPAEGQNAAAGGPAAPAGDAPPRNRTEMEDLVREILEEQR